MDDRHALMEAACPDYQALRNITFELLFEVTATPGRASVRNPSLRVLSGAPLDPELERCILDRVISLAVEAQPMWPFLDYEGPVEDKFIVGDRR